MNLIRISFSTDLAVLKSFCSLNITLIDPESLHYRYITFFRYYPFSKVCRRSMLPLRLSTLPSSSFYHDNTTLSSFTDLSTDKIYFITVKIISIPKVTCGKTISNDTDVLKSNFSSSKLNCIGNQFNFSTEGQNYMEILQ